MLKRTPPMKTASKEKSTVTMGSEHEHTNDSESDIVNSDGRGNINKQKRIHKRRAVETPPSENSSLNLTDVMVEMRGLFETFSKNQKKEFEEMRSAIESQNLEIKQSIDFLSDKYDHLTIQINQLVQEKKEDKSRIKKLESKIEQLERQNRSNILELKSVPMREGETKSDLLKIVMDLTSILQVPIKPTEVKDIFRVRNDKSGNPIITELTTVIAKEALKSGFIKYLKEKKKGFLTSDLNFEGPPVPIYLSDSLTPKARRIFYLARNYRIQYGFKYCWTSHGKVYLRRNDGTPKMLIEEEEDLKKLSKE